MAGRLVLHIGSMKSGTSFVQGVLTANRERLAEHGHLWVGDPWREQVSAVLNLIDHDVAGGELPGADSPWQRLVDEIDAHPGTAIVSMEFLGPRDEATIDLIARTFAGTDLQVILTVRDLSRQLPAMWQESVQNRGLCSWEEYVDAVRDHPGTPSKPGRSFWRQQSFAEIAQRWSSRVGRDHFTLVTLPPADGSGEPLWDRFVRAADLPRIDYEAGPRQNPSIGSASAMVMRDLNRALDLESVNRSDYERIVKQALAKTGLVGRDEPKVGCDEPWLAQRARDQIARLRELDLRVVGDLADLEPVSVPGAGQDDLTDAERLRAAVDGLAYLATFAIDQRQSLLRLRQQKRRRRERKQR